MTELSAFMHFLPSDTILSPLLSLVLAISLGTLLYILKTKLNKKLRKIDKNLTSVIFAINLSYCLACFVLLIPVLTGLGVPTASLITLLGTSSLAIGLALKGFLSNIASGIMVLVQRPFVVGDRVEIQGTTGTVEKIDLFSVCIRTPTNELVYLQNNKLISDKIINKNKNERKRLELTIEVHYQSDITRCKKIIADCISTDERIMTEPAPIILTDKMGTQSMTLLIRFWVMGKDILSTKEQLLDRIKIAYDAHHIQRPHPKLEMFIIDP